MASDRLNYAAIIKERVTSRELLESVGIHVDRRGMAKCPFHGDGDASLKVYSDARRGWHCYGCHVGGDPTDFYMRWHGVSFKEAVARINEEFSLGLPIREKPSREELRQIRAEIERRRREKAAKQAAIDEAEAVYWAAFEAWLMNEAIIAEQAPRGPFDAMSEAFVYAITHSAQIRDNLNIAEERWCLARAG